MKTSDPTILKQFYTVLNRQDLTDNVYQFLLKEWGFENLNLEEEQIKINQKKSTLSKSKRDAVPEFIKIKKLLDSKKTTELNNLSNTIQDQNLINDQIML